MRNEEACVLNGGCYTEISSGTGNSAVFCRSEEMRSSPVSKMREMKKKI